MERARSIRTALAGAVAITGIAAPFSASEARANTVAAMVQPTIVASIFTSTCGLIPSPAPSGVVAQPLTVEATKRAAILGGNLSALDRIKMQQASADAAVKIAEQGAIPADLAPAAKDIGRPASRACAPIGTPGLGNALVKLPGRFSADDFLESKRVRIGVTSFDSDWRRVQKESVKTTLWKEFGRDRVVDIHTVEAINGWVNRKIAYVEDRDLFKKPDYWAGARKTLRIGKGDCEDYALTKMQLLAAAGFSRSDMYLTIARDRVRNADHAVLVVKLGERYLVLDNATDDILDGSLSHDYAPVLSFNSRAAWLHGY